MTYIYFFNQLWLKPVAGHFIKQAGTWSWDLRFSHCCNGLVCMFWTVHPIVNVIRWFIGACTGMIMMRRKKEHERKHGVRETTERIVSLILFLGHSACLVHLLSLPVIPFHFTSSDSSHLLSSPLLSVYSSTSSCLWFSCPLGADTVPWWRKVCVMMPAGWETERFQRTRSDQRKEVKGENEPLHWKEGEGKMGKDGN